MGTSDAKLDQCLAVLGGPTDEHKFAGLLMVTKHLADADATTLQAVRARVLATTGTVFFLRLLHTKGSHDEALSPYRALALNLISSFCGDATLANEFAKASVVADTLEALQLGVAAANATVVTDCRHVLQGLYLHTAAGPELLAEHGLVPMVVQTMVQCCAVQPLSDAHEIILQHLVDLLRSIQYLWKTLSSHDFNALLHCFGAIESRSIAKCHLQELLLVAPDARWIHAPLANVVSGLFGAWPEHGHASTQRRDTSLALIERLFSTVGGAWLLPTPDAAGDLVVLVVQLAAIEAKLLLDDAERAWIDVRVNESAVEVIDGADDRLTRMIPICYGILEAIVSMLAGSRPDIVDASLLSGPVLAQLQDALSEFFTVVLQFLTTSRDFLATFPTSLALDMVVYASIRVFGAWLAEESDFCQADVLQLLPFLLQYQPSLLTDESTKPPTPLLTDPLHFLLPGLLSLSADEAVATALLDDDAVLQRLLQFGVGVCANADTPGVVTMCLGVYMNLLLIGSPSFTAKAHFQKTLPVYLKLAQLTGQRCMTSRVYDDDATSLLLHLLNYCLLVLLGSSAKGSRATDPGFRATLQWAKANAPPIEWEASYDLHELLLHLAARDSV
ncbi:hypothetical protein SPRG_07566 [Saprolegnia parasitica CBS 223.65]|uniref:Neurochondrin n=1 Tax=Saprolegnia parasitica (strain CBS 223.65) TaxID=695850 RepID=A0A067CKJ9_SAPPC|nr:hypothetical protein SPRG_07566 [Saprolegnia parasitica CBS 223.65]KDO27317.1 hypothetical protein SPRG_07566 [Saprolegnia parasitica CBS 223.65]|eukprot:XP_012202090.1 hypothetical protein SPRG_07566 [Saprolegnia parasitica CBS 223.65]